MPTISKTLIHTAVASVLASLAAVNAIADNYQGEIMKKPSSIIAQAQTPLAASPILPVEQGYIQIRQQPVIVDNEKATLTRYERADQRNAGIGGEHFSTVIDENGLLKGFTRMDLSLREGTLPAREIAQEIAVDFLKVYGADLLSDYKTTFIDPHDETIRIHHDGKTENVTLTGMKVKMHNNADGRWFWVIVGSDHKVMVFERDIVWINFPGLRKTEKWLHDEWLAKQEKKKTA